ncbi:hypothetical protein N7533_009096 [Penicillium manginii]|uniref:uncharacterized protein n=1 Tax=Penicillium manginii TaxID=203109 RepID=UPI0025483735|nr:uncharacterized protein N7533_009096 [Penicillium manginii]KAJ5744226.1 hypothetical protein N7533_009096 [Penicillium manginii]
MLKTKKWMKQTSLQVPASNQPSNLLAGWTGFLPYGSSLPWLCELFWEISWRIQALPFRKEILLEFPFQLYDLNPCAMISETGGGLDSTSIQYRH